MVTRCALLLGGFLIVCDGLALAQVTEMFLPIAHRFIPFQYSSRSNDAVEVLDCWCALHRARLNGWIDFAGGDVDVDRCIDMREYLHYDSPANGALHVLVPGAPSQALHGGAVRCTCDATTSFSAGLFEGPSDRSI
jgi:hypothetical protein